jgi:hypothetical protein
LVATGGRRGHMRASNSIFGGVARTTCNEVPVLDTGTRRRGSIDVGLGYVALNVGRLLIRELMDRAKTSSDGMQPTGQVMP